MRYNNSVPGATSAASYRTRAGRRQTPRHSLSSPQSHQGCTDNSYLLSASCHRENLTSPRTDSTVIYKNKLVLLSASCITLHIVILIPQKIITIYYFFTQNM